MTHGVRTQKVRMLFKVIETFRDQDAKAVYRRFRDKGRMMPDRPKFVCSYVSDDLGRCFQLMEADDVTRFCNAGRPNKATSRSSRSSQSWRARHGRGAGGAAVSHETCLLASCENCIDVTGLTHKSVACRGFRA